MKYLRYTCHGNLYADAECKKGNEDADSGIFDSYPPSLIFLVKPDKHLALRILAGIVYHVLQGYFKQVRAGTDHSVPCGIFRILQPDARVSSSSLFQQVCQTNLFYVILPDVLFLSRQKQQMPDQIGQAFTFPGYPPECFDGLAERYLFSVSRTTASLSISNKISLASGSSSSYFR